MWFHQSKSAEADWALNTSAAATAAWKEGVSAVTAVREGARGFFYRVDGVQVPGPGRP